MTPDLLKVVVIVVMMAMVIVLALLQGNIHDHHYINQLKVARQLTIV